MSHFLVLPQLHLTEAPSSHRASSPPSVSALKLLEASLSGPYPASKPSSPPLSFDLEVVDSKAPTPDQLSTILSYLQPSAAGTPSVSTFLSAHPSSSTSAPDDVKGVAKLANDNPASLKWPIVVDWTGGRASVGDVEGVKGILEAIRQQRDGEAKDEDLHQPKGWFS